MNSLNDNLARKIGSIVKKKHGYNRVIRQKENNKNLTNYQIQMWIEIGQ